jgi:hypothetical protein
MELFKKNDSMFVLVYLGYNTERQTAINFLNYPHTKVVRCSVICSSTAQSLYFEKHPSDRPQD